jgi:nitrogen-specific signal transduction histidine kinase
MARNFEFYNPEALLKTYIKPKDGLLSMMQPLIAQISYFISKQNPNLSFDDITISFVKSFLKTAPIAAAFLNLDYKFTAVSPKWFSWFKDQLSMQEKHDESLIGKQFFELFNPCPQPIENMLRESLEAKKHSRGLLKYDFKGQNRWVKWESFPWYNNAYQPCGIMVFCEDVTKFYKISMHNKKLEQCNQMLEDALMVFFHDLIQPMRQIGNFIELLKDHSKKHGTKDDFLDYAFSSIHESLEQMRNLSEGIVLYCKEGELTINPEEVSFHQIIKQIEDSCLLTSKADIKNLVHEDIYIHANKISMIQLFQNLLVNAVKHAPDEKPIITISGQQINNDFYQFSLHNYGNCSLPQFKKRIFEPFQSSFADGAGLGLAICKKIVTAYKGMINVESSPKKGTTVSVTLPVTSINRNSYLKKSL